MVKKSVTYTIRVKEEDYPKVEKARRTGATLSAILLKGAESFAEVFKGKS